AFHCPEILPHQFGQRRHDGLRCLPPGEFSSHAVGHDEQALRGIGSPTVFVGIANASEIGESGISQFHSAACKAFFRSAAVLNKISGRSINALSMVSAKRDEIFELRRRRETGSDSSTTCQTSLPRGKSRGHSPLSML